MTAIFTLTNGDSVDLTDRKRAPFVKVVTVKQLVKLVKNCDTASVDVPTIGGVRIVKGDFLAMLDDCDAGARVLASFDGLDLLIYGFLADDSDTGGL